MQSHEELLTLLIDRAEDYALIVLDPDGRVLTWNRGAQRLKGYRAEEIIGQHLSTLYPAESRQEADEALRIAVDTGRCESEGWRLRKDGTRFWGNVVLTALRDAHGTLTGFSKIVRDLTERKRAEEYLRKIESRFRLFMTGMQEYGVLITDPEGRIADSNTAAENLLGYSHSEMKGLPISKLFLGSDQKAAERELRDATATGRASDDRWHVRKDGTIFWANGITSALRDEEGELQGFAKVLRDRTDRKQIEEELRLKTEKLEEADRRKNEFLAMLAHELRNPLAPISTVVTLLESEALSDNGWQAVGVLSRQVEKFGRLINDLMDASRIAQGRIQVQKQRVDLRNVLNGAIASTKATISEHQHTLSVSIPEEPLWLSGDSTRLEQVFENLLNNAAKYTDIRGQIWLTARSYDGWAVVNVRDTGSGIPPELLPNVFNLFTQSTQSLERSKGGLGIGLAIVKSIVEMHDGKVEASTGGIGHGSEFSVRLPLEQAPDSIRPPKLSTAPGEVLKRRVLVVDDNVDAANMLALLLRVQGHEVETAFCGFDALETAKQMKPQLILLDIGLPGLDGYQVANRLREQSDMADTVLVAVTGYGQPEDRQRSKDAGFDYHLVKPVKPEDIGAIIRALSRAVP